MKLIFLLASYVIFSFAPAAMLGREYGMAIGYAYGALSLTLLAIFQELVKLGDEFARAEQTRDERIRVRRGEFPD